MCITDIQGNVWGFLERAEREKTAETELLGSPSCEGLDRGIRNFLFLKANVLIIPHHLPPIGSSSP